MTDLLFFIAIGILFIGLVLFFLLKKRERTIGSLKGKILYQDSANAPVLYAKTLPLCGKPDYIIQVDKMIVPIEVKTGRTPTSPYPNNTMQLMTYCYIATEVFGIRPKGGILKYPDREFTLEYTKEAEESVKKLVGEIEEAKESGVEFHCSHSEHN